MLDHRLLWPSAKVTTQILEATALDIPSDFDSDALRIDLNRCREYVLARQIGAAGFKKGHKKAAAAIAEHARKLADLLKCSGNRLVDLQLWMALELGHYDAALKLLETIAREAGKISARGVTVGAEFLNGHGSKGARATKDYIVELLGPIYERHFGRPAGRSHDGFGPFPRFVDAVSAAMGRSLRVSRHTVHKSLASRKHGVGKT
jgi:hypothetical protein